MEYRRLAKPGLCISRIGLGCDALGGTDCGKLDPQQAVGAVHTALDAGITLFDTADCYGLGRAEEVLGGVLGPLRYQVTIVTKFGVNWEVDPRGGRARTFRDTSRVRVFAALEASLRRLRLDCIPLYLVHWPDPATPIAETIGALIECRQAGKIRDFGVSNFSLDLLRQTCMIEPPAVVQLPYSLLARDAESDLLPFCQSRGIDVLGYGPLAQGLLTGKYGPGARFGPEDRRHRLPHFSPQSLARARGLVERVEAVGRRCGKSAAQVALRWTLDRPGVTSVIVGAKSPAQARCNCGAAGWRLQAQDLDALDACDPTAHDENGDRSNLPQPLAATRAVGPAGPGGCCAHPLAARRQAASGIGPVPFITWGT